MGRRDLPSVIDCRGQINVTVNDRREGEKGERDVPSALKVVVDSWG